MSTRDVAGSGEYDVHIGFKYYRYSEPGGRHLELDREAGLDVTALIHVPTAARWRSVMPDWASDNREVILDRIRQRTQHLNDEWVEC